MAIFEQEGLLFHSFLNPMMRQEELRVDGFDNNLPKNLTIPSEINGLPVTVIGKSAFRGCNILEQVNYPDSISCFEDDCFARCENLKVVSSYKTNYSATNVHIFHYAFYKCKNLLSFQCYFPISVFYEAFHGCEKLQTLDAFVSGLGSYAFCETALTEIHLYDKVLWCKNSFYGIKNLKDIYFAGTISEDVCKTYLKDVKKKHFCLHVYSNKFNFLDWVYEGVNIIC